jgi:cell wall-associated NlpC family hydrolase
MSIREVGAASVADLIGVPYHVMDCYALVREAVGRLRGVWLPESAAECIASPHQWAVEVTGESLRLGDVLELDGSDPRGHLAVVIDPAKQIALHARHAPNVDEHDQRQRSITTQVEVLVAGNRLRHVWRIESPPTGATRA